MTGMEPVRSAARVLRVLEALNTGEATTVAHLAILTRLPRPTIVRLLRTLVAEGYARQISRTGGYAVTESVLWLSDGFRHTDRLVAAARAPLEAFTADHKWPVNLQVCDRAAMRSRYTTGGRSPLSIDPPRVGLRFPILTTAHGQAYIAFCARDEREIILSMLRASGSPANAPARDLAFVEAMIAQVRRQGYALRQATPRDRVVGFAVPVLRAGGVAGTVGMRYFASALSAQEAVGRYLPHLQALAASISAALGQDPLVSRGEIS